LTGGNEIKKMKEYEISWWQKMVAKDGGSICFGNIG
jgi:hypothetical protein